MLSLFWLGPKCKLHTAYTRLGLWVAATHSTHTPDAAMTNQAFDPHEKIILKDGAITLCHRLDRGDPRIWQATYKLPDGSGTKRKSTQKHDREEAKKVALSEFDELLMRQRFGLAMYTKSFATIADDYLGSLRAAVDRGEREEWYYNDHHRIIERFLKPQLGNKNIDTITTADIERFVDWRKAYWTTGPGSKLNMVSYKRNGRTITRPVQRPRKLVPDKLTAEFAVLRRVFTQALKQGVVREGQIPSLKNEVKRKAKGDNRRPAFSIDDWVKIKRYRHEFVSAGVTDQNANRRTLLYDLMDFLLASGIRPGTESNAICWKHISLIKMSGKTYVQVQVPAGKGKTGERSIIALPRAIIPLRSIARIRNAHIFWIEEGYSQKGLDDRRLSIHAEKPGDLERGRLAQNRDFIAMMRPDEKVFCLANGTFQSQDSLRQLFETLLRQVGVTHASNGKKYAMYSLRHTYATFRLQKGTGVYGLAQNMGTSVKMIEQHYGQVPTISIAEDLTR